MKTHTLEAVAMTMPVTTVAPSITLLANAPMLRLGLATTVVKRGKPDPPGIAE